MTLCARHFLQSYIQDYFQLIAQLFLVFLHVSAVNCSHLQGAACVDVYRMVYNS